MNEDDAVTFLNEFEGEDDDEQVQPESMTPDEVGPQYVPQVRASGMSDDEALKFLESYSTDAKAPARASASIPATQQGQGMSDDQAMAFLSSYSPEQTGKTINLPAMPWYENLAKSTAAQTAASFIRQAEGFERAGAAPVTDLSRVNAPFQRAGTSEEVTSTFDKSIADQEALLSNLQSVADKKGFVSSDLKRQMDAAKQQIGNLQIQKQQTLERPEYSEQAQQELLQERQQMGQEATQLEQKAKGMFPYFGVNASDESVSAQIGRGVGTFAGLAPAMVTGPLSLPIMATQGASQAYAEGYNAKAEELKKQGVADQGAIDKEAHQAGSQAAVGSVPQLAAYMVGGALTTKATSALLKGSSPIVKGLVGGTAAAGVNLATSGGLRVAQGGSFAPTTEQSVPDILFGAIHGVGSFAQARAEAKAKIDASIGGSEPKVKPSENSVVNKREAQILAGADAQAEVPKTPDQMKVDAQWAVLKKQAAEVANQLGELPENHPDRPALRERAAKIAQQIADLRDGKPIDIEVPPVEGDERFKPKPDETTTKDQEQKTSGVSSVEGVTAEGKPKAKAEEGTAQPQGEGAEVKGEEGEKQQTTEAGLREAYPNTAFFDEANEAIQRLNQEDARKNKRTRFAAPSLRDLLQLKDNPAYKLADKLAGIFGKKIVLYKGEVGTKINGATGVDPALKNYIFLKIDGARPHLFTAGHELWHHIELYSPVLATDLRNKIKPLIKNWNKLNKRYSEAGYDSSRYFDEHIGDFLGDAMQDPKFWNDLAKKNPKSFKELATQTVDWLNKLLYQLKDWKMGGEFTRDIEKARNMLADGLNNFAEGKDEPVPTRKKGKAKTPAPKAETPEGELKVTIKRDKDFSFNGEYNVTIGDRKFKIFRDSETGYWRDAEKIGSKYGFFEGILSTENRAEAIEKLKKIVASEEGEGPMFQQEAEEQKTKDFYSQLQRTIEEKMPNKASVLQIKSIIDPAKGSGVKPNELKWSNIDGFLEGKQSVTKQEVLDYLRNEGSVKFEEVRLGARPDEVLSDADKERLAYLEKENAKAPLGAIDDRLGSGTFQELMKLQNIRDKSTAETLYAKQEEFERQARQAQRVGNQTRANSLWKEANHMTARVEALEINNAGIENRPKYEQYVLPNGENYREVVLTMPGSDSLNLKAGMEARQMDDGTWNIWDKNGWVYREGSATKDALLGKASQDEMLAKPNQETYRSSHFREIPNYVAHMRLDERKDASGKDGLFIEEIQSDRHQQGREKGYIGEGETSDAVKQAPFLENKIPDAPFRKDWSVQMFKRALRDAIASGKEWIGWTKGDTQAERYDLSKQVDSIEVIKSGDNKYHVTAYKNDKDVVNDPNVSQDKLPDMIGKELANKAIDQINSSKDPEMELANFSGVDLKVGGEGMKGFYDQILPKEIGKYVKKWGAKVEEGAVLERKAGSTWMAEYPDGRRGTVYTEEGAEMARERGAKVTPTETKETPIWKVAITPEMRESVAKEGQPMFQQDRPELDAGDKDTGAYHYGDLGIADDTKYSRMSASRGTGHFGTGTYFLGEKSAGGKYGGRSDRPIVNVNLEGLNLAKPKDPMRLHDALKLVNKMVYREEKPQFSEERFDGNRALFGLNYELGFSKHSKEEIQKAIEDTYNEFASGENDGFRSPSTVVMQKLGYDGIDVRGTKADNTDYGSVVYPKQETPMFQQDRPTEQKASKEREKVMLQATPVVKKTRNTIVNTFKRKPAKESIAYMRDAGDNAANIVAKQQSNEIANDLKREFNKQKDQAAEALSFVIEAKGDPAELANMKQKIENSPDASPAWQKKSLAAIDFAQKNFSRFDPMVQKYEQIGLQQVVEENANGIDTPVREGYVPHYQDLEEQELFGGAGTASATGFRKMRTYDTFADSIANGVDPKSINAVDLLQKRLSSGQKSINYRSWIDSLKATIDPVSGDPIATKISIVKRPDGSSYTQIPRGYKVETLAGQSVAIKNGYEGILSALNDPSAWRGKGGQIIQKIGGTGKAITLGLDTYHLGRIAIWQSLIKSLGIKTFQLPFPSYKKGVTLLDQSIPELQKMIANGEIPKAWAKGLMENKRLLNLSVKTGYNIGGISDALHQDWVHKIPAIGSFNSWLFNQFQRGAMAETWLLEFQRYRSAYPELSETDVARKVSKDLNTRFGNLGRQGILKSKTMQDTARFLFLAPQWNEGLIRTELGAMGQTGKALVDAATGKRFFAGILARSVGGMVVAQFIANQLINYGTRGIPTWENPEEGFGEKISAWIPDFWGGPGFFLNPMSLAMETTNLLMKGYERTGDAVDTAMNYFRSRSSVPMRPVWDAVTNKDVLGTYYAPGEKWKGMLKDSIPMPIAGGAIYSAAKEGITGEANQQFAGQYQKQLFSTFGVKLEQAPSDESRLFTLAHHYKLENDIPDRTAGYSYPYKELNHALMIGNVTNARKAMTELLKTKPVNEIKEYYKKYPTMKLLQSNAQMKEFMDTLTDEQRETYDRAKDKRKETSQAALEILADVQ